jgi:hypothetical protein
MPNVQAINTAVYRILSGSDELSALCMVYKGAKRPGGAINPSVTVDTKRLEPGEGEGMWIGDIVITVYADNLPNRTADHETIGEITSLVASALDDAELDLYSAKAFPLIEGGTSGIEWMGKHDSEAAQECTYGLVFVDFT